MELSLALGLPLSQILMMPERDLRVYAHYAAQFGLPNQRIEIYLAQTAYFIAATMGGYKGSLNDFLLKTSFENQADEEMDVFEGFSPDY